MHILCPHCRNPIEIVKLSPRDEIVCPSCGSSFHVETGSTTGWERTAGQKFGKFEVLETVGQGAFGTVYKARDTELDRVVAVKVPRAGNLAGPQELDRFLREARSVAQLRHPSIVSVHDVGQADGVPYLVSDFVQGMTLTDLLSARRPGYRAAAELTATVADALHYAHEQGVVHRDVKPSNIMIQIKDEGGRMKDEKKTGAIHPSSFILHPFLMDFGLAKREAGEITMTMEGQVLGTPAYMPPEQARGEGHDVDARGDVYSLGVVLYQLLTGELPFRGTARMLLHQVLTDEPRAPRSLNDHIPRDLETITLKAMAKEPGRRYATARDFADDLRRWLKGEPIRARRVSRVERTAKWVKRNPLVTALVALVVLSVLGGASGTFVKYLDAKEEAAAARRAEKREEEQKVLAEERKTQAEERERKALYQLATSNVLLAQAAWNENHVPEARERLELVPPELRRWEWYYLNRKYQGGIFALDGHTGGVGSVAFSPDGTRLATGGDTARLWDARTGQPLLECKGHTDGVTSVAFSPDGTRLATASYQDKTARLWDARTGQPILEFKDPISVVRSVAFSPDGTRLATAGEDRTARLWDARTGKFILECKGHTDIVTSVAFSPDGTRLATASIDATARLWDTRTGKELLKCEGHALGVQSVAFSPDGTRLATASHDHTARLWDARTGQFLLECMGHTGEVWSVAFSPDGSRLATASWDKTARVWDARTGQTLLECKGHTDIVNCVSFSPDGTRLATASGDGPARLWDARTGQPLLECKGQILAQVNCVSFSPDGKRLATASEDQTARLWNARTGQFLLEFKGHTGAVWSVAFSPDGKRLATASEDQTARLWDARTGQLLLECKGHTGGVQSVSFSPDGTQLATASEDKTARLWDARTGQPLLEFKGHTDGVTSVAFSPDGSRLATTSGGKLWLPWVASVDKTARLWDARTGQPLLEYKGHADGVTSVAFSPDGSLLVTASQDQTARLWDARTGQFLLEYKGHTDAVRSVAFSPDGTRLATGSRDNTARLWDALTGQPLLVCRGHTGPIESAEFEVISVAFSPDGTRLATANNDGTARLWDARPLPLPQDEELEYRLWATRAEPDWHRAQFQKVQSGDRFAAAFHLDRFLAYRPAQRADLLEYRTLFLEETLKQNKEDATARLLLARTAWHSPTLGPKDTAELMPSADDKNPIARRTRGGLLLRQQKAADAVELLEAALKDRGDDQPPVEELLLAWAYHETKQPDKAKELWTKATTWLDRGQVAVRAVNVAGTLPAGVLPGVAPLFAPPLHPRYNAFDWETWYEIDVLRRELAPRFTAPPAR